VRGDDGSLGDDHRIHLLGDEARTGEQGDGSAEEFQRGDPLVGRIIGREALANFTVESNTSSCPPRSLAPER
jgi:hypothetical protein